MAKPGTPFGRLEGLFDRDDTIVYQVVDQRTLLSETDFLTAALVGATLNQQLCTPEMVVAIGLGTSGPDHEGQLQAVYLTQRGAQENKGRLHSGYEALKRETSSGTLLSLESELSNGNLSAAMGGNLRMQPSEIRHLGLNDGVNRLILLYTRAVGPNQNP